jgi:anti-sigma factor RsiW
MQEREDRGERLHRRVWELLPWYVNGSLSQRERERIETHLAVCRLCREEERTSRRTAEMVKGAGEVAPTPHPVQLQRVLARIDEAEREAPAHGVWRRLAAPFRALIDATPRPLRGALVAQVAVILMLVGVLVWPELRPSARSSQPPAVYRTLSDPGAPPAPSLRLRVMFSPKATERQIRGLLLGLRGEITSGPSPLGVYTLSVPAVGESLQAVLARLRSEPQVMLAEPVVGEESREESR